MISAGRVLIIPKGEYDATTSYSPLDLVSYNGSSYIAKQNTTGNLPTNTTYWQLSAYGGSAANLAANFAPLEITDYASKSYAIDDFLVTNDNQFCKVIANIALGDELVLDTNIEATDVGTVIQAVISYVAGLDANNVKLRGEAAISVQTDLNNLTTPGNYYKSATNIYVTNAPDGISEESTAVFRLTVENGSDTTNKLLQTLVTNDGETYKRGFNGSAWSDWIHFADATEVSSEIQTLTNNLNDEIETRAKVSAHNFLPSTAVTDTINGVTFTVNPDKSVTVSTDSGGATADAVFPLCRNIKIKSGMIFKGCPSSGGVSKYYMAIENTSPPYTRYALDSGEGGEISESSDGNNFTYIRVVSGQILTTPITFYPEICLATDLFSEYVEYAMTNRELTFKKISNTVSGVREIFNAQECIIDFNNANLGNLTDTWATVCTVSKIPPHSINGFIVHNSYIFIVYIGTSGNVQMKTQDGNTHEANGVTTQFMYTLI